MSDRTPTEVVRAFCEACAQSTPAELGAWFTDDAVYHNIPVDPVTGPEQIVATLEMVLAGFDEIEFRILAIAADGNRVLTERVDVFRSATNTVELPVMGIFEVDGQRISAWRDYFDLQQFLTQAAAK